ncbi:hypothetical protein ABIA33_003951 [Streptacidiphilus sp. MAP12-16]
MSMEDPPRTTSAHDEDNGRGIVNTDTARWNQDNHDATDPDDHAAR